MLARVDVDQEERRSARPFVQIARDMTFMIKLDYAEALVFGTCANRDHENTCSGELMGKKVVVLGLDGFPYTLMKKLTKQGVMPSMAGLVEHGSLVQMDSIYPTVSSVAWSSFVTGKNPGRFGVFGFTEVSKNFKLQLPTSRNIRAKTIWEIASAAGKSVIGLGVPLTHPPRPVNGILVSGFLAPRLEGAVSPSSALAKLRRTGYKLDIDPMRARQSVDLLCEDLIDVFDARSRTLLDFYESEPWDLLVCHVMETDRLGHFMWHHVADGGDGHGEFVVDFFRKIDRLIGEIASRLDDDTTLVVMSDHGFCRVSHEVQVNHWLESEGYLKTDLSRGEGAESIAPGSKAFAQVPGRIHILREDSWREGAVSSDEYEQLRDEIISGLKKWTDTSTGKNICRKVMKKEEVFEGPFLATAPDIVMDPTDGYDLKGAFGGKEPFTHGPITGMHTQWDALLYISSHEITDRRPVVSDIGATVLELMDVAVPDDWQGVSVISE